MMKDLGVVANLVECGRICVRVSDRNPGRYYVELGPKNELGRQAKAHSFA